MLPLLQALPGHEWKQLPHPKTGVLTWFQVEKLAAGNDKLAGSKRKAGEGPADQPQAKQQATANGNTGTLAASLAQLAAAKPRAGAGGGGGGRRGAAADDVTAGGQHDALDVLQDMPELFQGDEQRFSVQQGAVQVCGRQWASYCSTLHAFCMAIRTTSINNTHMQQRLNIGHLQMLHV